MQVTLNTSEIKAGLALMEIFELTDKEKESVGLVLEGPQKQKVDEDHDFEITIPDEFMEYLRKCARDFAHWPTNRHVPDLEERLKL